MRCALYARVSTEEQAERFGLGAQLTELREFARHKGYIVRPECELIDDGYLGGDLDRPALNRLRELAHNSEIDVALVHDPDRLARKLSHQIILAEELEQARVRLEFVTTPTDNTPEGKMFLTLKGVFAEYEKEKIRERTLRGRRQKAREGYIVGGRTPLGYRYLGKPHSELGRYVINEEEAEVVRLIFRWLVEEGLSIRAIVTRLNQLGYRPQRSSRWGKSSVHRILCNPAYAGTSYYNRRERSLPRHPRTAEIRRNKKTALRPRPASEWIPISVPAIIEGSLFERAQGQLRQNSEMSSGRNTKHFYLLRALLRCGVCGRKFVGLPSHGRRYYRCQGRDRLNEVNHCKAGLLHADRIENFVWETVLGILRDPSLLSQKLERHADELATGGIDLSSEVTRLEQSLSLVERKEARALEAYLNESLQLPALTALIEELGSQKKDLVKALQKAKEEVSVHHEEISRGQRIARFCRLALRGLGNLDEERRQRLLRSLIDEIKVDGQELEIRGVLPGRVGAHGGERSDSGSHPVAGSNRPQHSHSRGI